MPENRWKVMHFKCPVPECGRGTEVADHARRLPSSVGARCPGHGPMKCVKETQLWERPPEQDEESSFAAVEDALVDSFPSLGPRPGVEQRLRDRASAETAPQQPTLVCPACGVVVSTDGFAIDLCDCPATLNGVIPEPVERTSPKTATRNALSTGVESSPDRVTDEAQNQKGGTDA